MGGDYEPIEREHFLTYLKNPVGRQILVYPVLLLANSKDYELANDTLSYFKDYDMVPTLINASAFTSEMKVENRVIIILGGPDTSEGIGEIVKEALSDAEEASVRDAGAPLIFLNENVWTDKWTNKQKVIIIVGLNKNNFQTFIYSTMEKISESLMEEGKVNIEGRTIP
jgi:hypothetical protein